MWVNILFVFEQIVCFALAYRLLFRMKFSRNKLSYMLAMLIVPVVTGIAEADEIQEGVKSNDTGRKQGSNRE